MTWIYKHKERECQNLTQFPHAFMQHSDYRNNNQMHLSHLNSYSYYTNSIHLRQV